MRSLQRARFIGSWRLSAAVILCVAGAAGRLAADAPPGRVLEGAPPDARLGKAVTLDGYHPWEPITDPERWQARAEATRRQILVAAGLWPLPEKAPLAPVIHGRIERDAYTIEKVFFESFPGFFVTGNLYRPKGRSGKLPAVLSPHGHWANGRLYERPEREIAAQIDAGKEKTTASARYPLQARCAQLARMGCVVFFYDMVGNADSRQIGHAAGFADVDAELRAQSAFGLQTWNTIRAFDFLSSLPDVDPRRIGVTGASGGGTQTFILCAIDPRPAVGFPAVMVSTDMQGGCVCENASHLRVGTTNIEFAALAAPRPYGMTGADDWTRDILEKGFPELRAMWKALGKEDLVAVWHHPTFEHNYNQVSREHMYEWFNRHLGLGQAEPVREAPFEPVPPDELRVFDDAHPLPANAVDAAALRRRWSADSDRQLEALEARDAAGLAEYRRVIGGALATMLHTSLPRADGVEAKSVGAGEIGGRRFERLLLGRRGAGEAVPALLFRPERHNGVVVVAVGELGKGALCFSPSAPPHDEVRGEVRALLEGGAAVLAPDVFLTGEYIGEAIGDSRTSGADLAAFPKDAERHGRYVGYTYGYNRTLIAQRVHDILTAVAYARSLPGARAVHLLGRRRAAGWTLLARALAGDAVGRAALATRGFTDYAAMDSLDHPDFLPGALKYGGMPAFAALCAPGDLRIVAGGADRIAAKARAAYAAASAAERLSIEDTGERGRIDALLEWVAAAD